MNIKLLLTMIIGFVASAYSRPITRACPTTCPSNTGAAQFCSLTVQENINAASLCVTGNAQIGGDLTVCGLINGNLGAYGYYYDEAFTTASLLTPAKIPFATPGVSFNITQVDATDFEINFNGVYLVTVLIEPSSALDVNSAFEILRNNVTVGGSSFILPAALTNIEYATQALVTAVAGDVISVIIIPNAPQETTLSGISSLIINKIA